MEPRFTSTRIIPVSLLLATLIVWLGVAAPAGASVAGAGSSATDRLLARLAVQQAQLTAADGAAQDALGCSVAVSGDTAVVGADGVDVGVNTDQGAAYVFVRSGSSWTETARLTADDGASWDGFGWSVALSGDIAVVGARDDAVAGRAGQGSAYVFVRSGTTWAQEKQLVAGDGAAGDQFGGSVAVSGETVVAGAYHHHVGPNMDQGAAYVFVRGAATWTQEKQLTALDGAAGSAFGSSVAISGDTAVVGAIGHDVGANVGQGAAYVFVRSGSSWTEQARLTAADGAADDAFGSSVAVSGDAAVVGAPRHEVDEKRGQGAAYVFARSDANWTQQARLTAGDGLPDDEFGRSVAISGETAVVGVPYDEVAVPMQGSACVFTRSGAAWTQTALLTASDHSTGDWFGEVAISGDTAVVGASGVDVGATADQGSACVFLLSATAKPGKPAAKSPKGLISSRTPAFRWTTAAGAATYEVRIYRGSRLIKARTGIAKTSWRCTKRLPRGVYLTWKVRARNAAGAGPWSTRPRFKVR